MDSYIWYFYLQFQSYYFFYGYIRERHKCFFQKSEILFVCMLKPRSFNIQSQVSEIEAAQVYVH